MAKVIVKKVKEVYYCDDCSKEIDKTHVGGEITLPYLKYSLMFCEECYCQLMDDMSSEYDKFKKKQ